MWEGGNGNICNVSQKENRLAPAKRKREKRYINRITKQSYSTSVIYSPGEAELPKMACFIVRTLSVKEKK